MEHGDVVIALGNNEVFGVLGEHTRDVLARHCSIHTHKKGDVVLIQDEPGDPPNPLTPPHQRAE